MGGRGAVLLSVVVAPPDSGLTSASAVAEALRKYSSIASSPGLSTPVSPVLAACALHRNAVNCRRLNIKHRPAYYAVGRLI